MSSDSRSPEEIRRSIEITRQEMAQSLGRLQSRVNYLTNWRRRVSEHKGVTIVGAALAGFVVGGGIAAVAGTLFGGED